MNAQKQILPKLIETLKAKHYSLGFAESCTGGLLSAQLTEISGVSSFYKGAVVAYANEVKNKLLGVPMDLIEKDGAVSESVAKAMAVGLAKSLSVDCAIAVTGVAGPNGGTAAKPVGTVCFAVMGPGFESSARKHFSGSRQEIQAQAVGYGFQFLLEELSKKA